jgi:hypothetical protein
MLGQSDGPEYVKPLDSHEFDERLRAFQEQHPAMSYMAAHDAVFAQMQKENAANRGVDALRRVLAEAGLL